MNEIIFKATLLRLKLCGLRNIDRAFKMWPKVSEIPYQSVSSHHYRFNQHDPIPEDQPGAAKVEECIKSIAEIEKQERDVE